VSSPRSTKCSSWGKSFQQRKGPAKKSGAACALWAKMSWRWQRPYRSSKEKCKQPSRSAQRRWQAMASSSTVGLVPAMSSGSQDKLSSKHEVVVDVTVDVGIAVDVVAVDDRVVGMAKVVDVIVDVVAVDVHVVGMVKVVSVVVDVVDVDVITVDVVAVDVHVVGMAIVVSSSTCCCCCC